MLTTVQITTRLPHSGILPSVPGFFVLCLSSLCLLASGALRAADVHWDAGATGAWFTPDSWRSGGGSGPARDAPDSGDNAFVNGGLVTISPDVSATSAAGHIGDGAQTSGTVSVAGVWSTTGFVRVGHNNGAGMLFIEKTGTLASSGGRIACGDGPPAASSTGIVAVDGVWQSSDRIQVGQWGRGEIYIGETGVVSSSTCVGIGGGGDYSGDNRAADGFALVAGRLSAAGDIQIACGATGRLQIGRTGAVTNASASIGSASTGPGGTGSGLATIAGLWQNSGTLAVGSSGTGVLNILATGTVASASGHMGGLAGSTGAATIAGLWQNSGNLHAANAASSTATIHIAPTGTLSNGIGYLGYVATATATVTVDGLWESGSYALIGRQGHGTVIVNQGGRVKVGAFTNLGDQADSNEASPTHKQRTSRGYVHLAGLWECGAYIRIGNNGDAMLHIAPTGTMQIATFSTIGTNTGVAGAATVAGLWENGGNLTIGHRGAGTLSIAPSGTVINSSGIIGSGATGSGTASVSGLWCNTGSLAIGIDGAGALSIARSGSVTADGAYSQNTASALSIDIDSSRATPYLVISGHATLAGALNVSGLPPPPDATGQPAGSGEAPADSILVMRATGGFDGDFSSINIVGDTDSPADIVVTGFISGGTDYRIRRARK